MMDLVNTPEPIISAVKNVKLSVKQCVLLVKQRNYSCFFYPIVRDEK